VEADLPEMAARKRQALDRMGSLGERHRVADLDVLRDESLAELAGTLDPGAGVAILTEGLLTYLNTEQVRTIWRRFAAALDGFPAGRYFSDLRLAGESLGPVERGFSVVLSAFVRGRVHAHFADEPEAEAALVAAGFAAATLHRGDLIHVIEARS
jgi:O-methyltransferase involved in polyketide biosynthesis